MIYEIVICAIALVILYTYILRSKGDDDGKT